MYLAVDRPKKLQGPSRPKRPGAAHHSGSPSGLLGFVHVTVHPEGPVGIEFVGKSFWTQLARCISQGDEFNLSENNPTSGVGLNLSENHS